MSTYIAGSTTFLCRFLLGSDSAKTSAAALVPAVFVTSVGAFRFFFEVVASVNVSLSSVSGTASESPVGDAAKSVDAWPRGSSVTGL